MVNIGEKVATAPRGLVTSIGFAALGKVFYAFEGNIHCTGGTIKCGQRLQMIGSPMKQKNWLLLWKTMEGCMLYRLLPDWVLLGGKGDIKAAILGMTFRYREATCS